VQEYVEEGTLRIEWRDFPYLGQESVNAAVAARAAQAQGKF
jgi:protein-disulfide isomerase